jgi:hypothetical protein
VEQLWQAPQVEVPQQKPPTQLPLVHSEPAVQAVPLVNSTTQTPASLQKPLFTQLALLVQLVGQAAAAPLQT